MRFSLFVAFRYFFSSSKQTIVNIINRISLAVVLVATAALFIVLSAFSGLKTFGLSFSNNFDPDLRISPASGKTLVLTEAQREKMKQLKFIEAFSPVLEEKIFLRFEDKTQVAFLKGVEESIRSVIEIDALISRGNWFKNEFNEVIIGGSIANNLSLGIYDYSSFLTLSVPRRNSGLSLGKSPFREEKAIVSGIYFASEDIDKKYLLARMDLARTLLERKENVYSVIEIKTRGDFSSQEATAFLQPLFEQDIIVRNRSQLNAALYKMLKAENIAVYLIFSLIIVIALFTVVGAISMIFLDKKGQMHILLTMGVLPKEIQSIFFFLGGMISWFGGVLGIVLGGVLVFVQQFFPFLYVPGTPLAYPVELRLENVLIVLGTIGLLGVLTAFWATRGIHRKVGL